jgi:hypothetical protein
VYVKCVSVIVVVFLRLRVVLGLMVLANKALGLAMWNFVRRYLYHKRTHSVIYVNNY